MRSRIRACVAPASHVEQLLREINPVVAKPEPAAEESDADVDAPAGDETDDKE